MLFRAQEGQVLVVVVQREQDMTANKMRGAKRYLPDGKVKIIHINVRRAWDLAAYETPAAGLERLPAHQAILHEAVGFRQGIGIVGRYPLFPDGVVQRVLVHERMATTGQALIGHVFVLHFAEATTVDTESELEAIHTLPHTHHVYRRQGLLA